MHPGRDTDSDHAECQRKYEEMPCGETVTALQMCSYFYDGLHYAYSRQSIR